LNIDELLGLMQTRRSVRKFKPDPIPDGYIEKMIEAARWAPSGANGQPWEFVIVKDRETKDKMAETYMQVRPESYYIEQSRVEELRHNNLRSFPKDPPGWKDAPVLIVVCGDRRTFQASTLSARYISSEGDSNGTYSKNMGNATFALHLAAAALGLGSQWASVTSDWEQLLKPLLNIPIPLQIHTIVPVGYPAQKPADGYRRELRELIHWGKYDSSRFRNGEQIQEFLRFLRNRTRPAYTPGARN
jgi:5,6-dimethylbenzimidazole synthase